MTYRNSETADSIPNWAVLQNLSRGKPPYLGPGWRVNVANVARRQHPPTSSLELFDRGLIVGMSGPPASQCALLFGDPSLLLTADALYLAPTIRADLAALREDRSRATESAHQRPLVRAIEVGDRLLLALHQLAELNGVRLQ